MVDLIEKTPLAGLLPASVGNTMLSEVSLAGMWSVAPFDGRRKATGAALKKMGLPLPDAGKMAASGAVEIIWFGHGQWMVSGVNDLPKLPAAVTEQSDGWVCVRVDGDAQAVLARLVPVDLRGGEGRVVRTLVGHMSAVVIGRPEGVFDVMVMRSMAHTLMHDLTMAAKGVAARG
ncbi:sarcosine oxidase subunit gamma [Yoonia sp. MH D7]